MGVQESGVEGEEPEVEAAEAEEAVPPGGSAPVLDEEGNPVPDEDPAEPTDVPKAQVEAIEAAEEEGEEGEDG